MLSGISPFGKRPYIARKAKGFMEIIQVKLSSIYIFLLKVVFVALVTVNSYAQSFCFLSATTDYEQVYCELQARGEAEGLPPFHQFKRNDESIQAVILKRPAERARIPLAPPKKLSSSASNNHIEKVRDEQFKINDSHIKQHQDSRYQEGQGYRQSDLNIDLTDCTLNELLIDCKEKHFSLIGNRLNHRLSVTALSDDNLMSLPRYTGAMNESAAVNHYLAETYRQYLEKMHEIGLAGVTMTYNKFAFLFYDLHEKGLDFSRRFETMYEFLKKDKASMGVSEKVTADMALKLEDCTVLSAQLLLCSRSGRNYLYFAVAK